MSYSFAVAARWLRRRAGFMPGDWFWAACLGWALGGVFCSLTGSFSTVDVQLHDTYFVIAQVHVCLWLAVIFGAFGLFYHYNRRMGNVLAMIHFWMTLMASLVFIWPYQYSGLAGMPRRYMDYSKWISFNQFGMRQEVMTWLWIMGLLAQVVFLVNIVYSMVGGRKSMD